jgi:hypothetical protein
MTSEETCIADAPKAKRASVSLTAGESRIAILALRKADDTGVTTVSTTDAKGKTTRGMTTRYATFALAVAALGQLQQEAVKKGWKAVERGGGFKAKPDAFTAMPVAPKTTK